MLISKIFRMASRVASGFLVFRKCSSKIQYLLLQTSYGENHWTPPKGLEKINCTFHWFLKILTALVNVNFAKLSKATDLPNERRSKLSCVIFDEKLPFIGINLDIILPIACRCDKALSTCASGLKFAQFTPDQCINLSTICSSPWHTGALVQINFLLITENLFIRITRIPNS